MEPVVIERRSLVEQAADALRAAIAAGDWPVGGRIPPEAELVRRLGVSRNTLREAVRSLAHAGMLPAFLAKLHPRYKTPTNAILLIGMLSTAAPLLGRKALVWFVDAGSLAIVIAYLFVALSFVVLRVREPHMPRPFKVRAGMLVGVVAVLLSVAMAAMYMPFSPSALVPVEWALFVAWMGIGLVLYVYSRRRYGVHHSAQVMARELS